MVQLIKELDFCDSAVTYWTSQLPDDRARLAAHSVHSTVHCPVLDRRTVWGINWPQSRHLIIMTRSLRRTIRLCLGARPNAAAKATPTPTEIPTTINTDRRVLVAPATAISMMPPMNPNMQPTVNTTSVCQSNQRGFASTNSGVSYPSVGFFSVIGFHATDMLRSGSAIPRLSRRDRPNPPPS